MNLADICNKLVKNSENIHQFLRHSKESEEIWKELTKCSYNYLKNEEKDLGFISDKSSLKKLYIKGVDIEQIWQQIELQNNSLLVASDLDSDTVSDNNLCYLVAKLSSSVIQDINDEEINSDNNTDEGVETGSGDEDELIEEEEEENSDLDDLGDDELDVDGEADLEKEEQIDFDADTFADLAQEGEDTTDSENDIDDEEQAASDDNEKILDDEQNNESTENKKFKSSLIDSKFLNLRESEWIADNDIIGKDDPDHIDFMEDIQSGESDDEIMYDQFFDPPPSEDRLEIEDKLNNQLDFEEEKSIEESAESEPKEDDTKQGPIDVQTKSKFDLELEREDSLKERLVDENYILEKPWAQKGEATKEQRPENSALEEPLEYNIAVSEKPVLTEDISKQIEKLILSRIRNQSWDDVERKQKPKMDPHKYKKQLVLDQEKSQKDLAKIYEEDYLAKQKNTETKVESGESYLLAEKDKEEEPEENDEIRCGLNKLFAQLDALSNYHFTPKQRTAEIKVITNLPAITMEESTPAASSDANLLAPQEVIAPLRGELKAEREKTSTDKNRQRRMKKIHQKKKAKLQEEKLSHQMKKKGKDGFMAADASVQFVQKAVKKGQIKLMKSDGKKAKSSESFFSLLEENRKTPKRKREEGRLEGKKKSKKNISSVAQIRL